MYLFTIFFLFNWKYLILLLSIYIFLFHRFPNYVSVKSKLQHAPPGIPQAFDTFAVPGGWEFDYQSLPGGGEFDPHGLGVGNLNCTLNFM